MSTKRKFWWPPWAYEARPAASMTFGGLFVAIGLAWSLTVGSWGGGALSLFALGWVLVIYGAVLVQLRREYRQNSKWTRDKAPEQKSRDGRE